jgi:hypothetical protein
MVMVLAATVKAPWRWCRSRPSFSHWVFDSLRPNDKVLPRSRLWRPRSTSHPAADGLRKLLNTYARHSPSPQMGRRTGSCRAPLSLAFKCFNSLYGRLSFEAAALLSSAAIAGVQVFQFFIRAAQFRGRCFLARLWGRGGEGCWNLVRVGVAECPTTRERCLQPQGPSHVCVRIAPTWWALP